MGRPAILQSRRGIVPSPFPRYREREARYRAAGPDIAACTDDIVHVRDIVRGARYRPPRAISRVRVVISHVSPTLSWAGRGIVPTRVYREREARYRAASDVIAAAWCDIVKPHDIVPPPRTRRTFP